MSDQVVSAFQSQAPLIAVVSLGVALAMVMLGYSVLRLLPRLRLSHGLIPTLCESLVLGLLAYSTLALLGVLFRVNLVQTFFVASAGLGIASVVSVRRRRFRSLTAGSAIPVSHPPADVRQHIISIAMIAVGSLLWSFNNIQGLHSSGSEVILVPWVDILFHARQIGNFAAFTGDFGTLNLAMYGAAVPPYHYASYMVPALVAALSGATAFQVATIVYPALGMMLTGAAMLVLVQSTAGARAACLAILLLFFLPDPSSWFGDGPKSASYFFFQQVGIGGAYAVGVIGLALAYAIRGFQLASRTFCAISLCVFCAAALFKAQIFLAYSPFFFVFVILSLPRSRLGFRVGIAVACIAFYALAVWLIGRVPNAPTLAVSTEGLSEYLTSISRTVFRSEPPPALVPFLLPLAPLRLFLHVYGILFLLAVTLAWTLRKDKESRSTILLLAGCLLAHAYVRLLIAENSGMGDTSEINRKTFVLPYFVMVYCAARLLARHCSLQQKPGLRRWMLAAIAGGLIVLTVSSATRLQDSTEARGKFTRLLFPPGLLHSAAYLRSNSSRLDVVQLCENDTYNALGTWSERPVYIARLVVNAMPATEAERARFGLVANAVQQATAQGVFDVLKPSGIRWLLMSSACRGSWETSHKPDFVSGEWRLYKVTY